MKHEHHGHHGHHRGHHGHDENSDAQKWAITIGLILGGIFVMFVVAILTIRSTGKATAVNAKPAQSQSLWSRWVGGGAAASKRSAGGGRSAAVAETCSGRLHALRAAIRAKGNRVQSLAELTTSEDSVKCPDKSYVYVFAYETQIIACQVNGHEAN